MNLTDKLGRVTMMEKIKRFLFKDDLEDLKKEIDKLILRNQTVWEGNKAEFFHYKGKTYSNEFGARGKGPPLHPCLLIDMEKYLTKEKEFQTTIMAVMGFIQKVMLSSDSEEDYKELLPEALHDYLENTGRKCGSRMPYDQLVTLKQENKFYYEKIQEQLTKNLLR